ncbi:DUF1993 family protein [Sphaerotilus sulfidivorans]|uniref:DUF1993 family protein n=1 Tax=Sphaerotilus sp. FB-3 TaxID=2913396 RepID=UPI00203B4E2C|nr:DUF1993 domain-containing protein [Sphaerotilus sp. FB-3]
MSSASSPTFDACVPVLLRYLESLERIVAAVEALPPARHVPALLTRLAPDMLSMHGQVQTAAYFALRTAYPLAGLAVPPYMPVEPDTTALRENIRHTRRLVEALSPAQFQHAQARHIREKAGDTTLELPAQTFLSEFALPNFFFHLSMAYAIARSVGCAIGKADYDGLHVYRNPA